MKMASTAKAGERRVGVIAIGAPVTWVALTAISGISLHYGTLGFFDCTEMPRESLMAALVFMAIVTAYPVLVALVFCTRAIPSWATILISLLLLIPTVVGAVLAGGFWLLTHMCP